MIVVIEVIKDTVVFFLTVVELAMLLRAIFSWLPIDQNRFIDILYAITEPFIAPVRTLFVKMNWFQGLPIDLSFLATYILISIVCTVLPLI